MRMRNKIAAIGVGAAILGGTLGYARDPAGVRLAVTNHMYESLPAQMQQEYAVAKFQEQEYDLQALVVKNMVHDDYFTDEDAQYIGAQSTLNLDDEMRAGTLNYVLENSGYETTKQVTLYGVQQLEPEDSLDMVLGQGDKVWEAIKAKLFER